VALSRQFGGEGLAVVGVNLGEDGETVRRFAERFGVQFPLLLDREGRSPERFGLRAHPNTVLIDRKGRLLGLVRGERDWQGEPAKRLIRHLLDDRRP
jgi:peroxiredoxin